MISIRKESQNAGGKVHSADKKVPSHKMSFISLQKANRYVPSAKLLPGIEEESKYEDVPEQASSNQQLAQQQ